MGGAAQTLWGEAGPQYKEEMQRGDAEACLSLLRLAPVHSARRPALPTSLPFSHKPLPRDPFCIWHFLHPINMI